MTQISIIVKDGNNTEIIETAITKAEWVAYDACTKDFDSIWSKLCSIVSRNTHLTHNWYIDYVSKR